MPFRCPLQGRQCPTDLISLAGRCKHLGFFERCNRFIHHWRGTLGSRER
jgi:hypothetical protein